MAVKKPRKNMAKAKKELCYGIIVEQYLRGNNARSISQLIEQQFGLKFSQRTIFRTIANAQNQWQKDKLDFLNNHKAIELEKINRLELAFWNTWESSGRKDCRFLDGVQDCITQRCKLLGLDVPPVAVQVNTGATTTIVRRVVFKTKETTCAPQILISDNFRGVNDN